MKVNSKFNQTYKVPKDLSFHSGSMFHGFLINAGYVAKHGEMACVERRSMTQLMSMVQALSFVPGYHWNAYHVRFTVVPAYAQIGDEAEAEARTGHLLLQKVKIAIEKRLPSAKVFYRWHLEWSPCAGWHYHAAIFINGSAVKGSRALDASFHQCMDENSTFEIVNPDMDRIKDETIKNYFKDAGLNVLSDRSFHSLENEIDYEYIIYWFSYMCKKHTKEAGYKIPSSGKRIKTTGGTNLPKKWTSKKSIESIISDTSDFSMLGTPTPCLLQLKPSEAVLVAQG